MMQPENENTAQHCLDLEAYESWVKKDRCARFTMLSSIMIKLGSLTTTQNAQEMWNQLKIAYGGTSITRLRALSLKFEQYVMDSKHSMANI